MNLVDSRTNQITGERLQKLTEVLLSTIAQLKSDVNKQEKRITRLERTVERLQK